MIGPIFLTVAWVAVFIMLSLAVLSDEEVSDKQAVAIILICFVGTVLSISFIWQSA